MVEGHHNEKTYDVDFAISEIKRINFNLENIEPGEASSQCGYLATSIGYCKKTSMDILVFRCLRDLPLCQILPMPYRPPLEWIGAAGKALTYRLSSNTCPRRVMYGVPLKIQSKSVIDYFEDMTCIHCPKIPLAVLACQVSISHGRAGRLQLSQSLRFIKTLRRLS